MLLWAALLGALAAILLAVYVILSIEDPYDRVAYYLTLLASDVTVSILAYVLLTHSVFIYLSTFLLAKLITWSLMNHKNMVHYRLGE